MQETQRCEILPELDELARKANKLKKELDDLVEQHHLYQDKSVQAVACVQAVNDAYKFVRALRETSDVLKQAGVERIRTSVTAWHHFRLDDEEGSAANPIYESITYNGEDKWTVIISTETHGRERVVVHSNTANWEQVSSAERA